MYSFKNIYLLSCCCYYMYYFNVELYIIQRIVSTKHSSAIASFDSCYPVLPIDTPNNSKVIQIILSLVSNWRVQAMSRLLLTRLLASTCKNDKEQGKCVYKLNKRFDKICFQPYNVGQMFTTVQLHTRTMEAFRHFQCFVPCSISVEQLNNVISHEKHLS